MSIGSSDITCTYSIQFVFAYDRFAQHQSSGWMTVEGQMAQQD